MIQFLTIQNLAVVEKLELELQPGLTVLTGETGAGKSIVLGALGLLVGGRAASDLLRTGESKAVVQAIVENTQGREIILRREITASGRSRAFIDDTLATASALQALGQQLIDLHGQHEHQALLDPRNHLRLLDAFAGVAGDASADVADRFRAWRAARGALDRLRLSDQDKAERTDLLTFQREEIDRVMPTPGEDESLSVTRTRLANADRLASLCGDAYAALYDRDDAVLARLGQIWRQVEELGSLDPTCAAQIKARDSVQPHLEELAFFLRSYAATIDASPVQLAEVEARLADLERLKKKHGPRLQDVLARRERIDTELDELGDSTARLAELAKAEAAARHAYLRASQHLSVSRHREGRALADRLVPVLADLAIPKARFEVRFESPLTEERWSESGVDAMEFYFSANPGEALRPLAKVASGGELSRVMLGLKSLASTDEPGKTLVFDEVDAGIGGAAADRVGNMLGELGRRFQILCVTHLPQIAAYATTHHRVSKVVQGDRTVTRIDRLAAEGKVMEIARLMTGGASRQAQESARVLLMSKQKTKGESERAKAKD